MSRRWIAKVEEDGDDLVLVFPEGMMEEIGWQEGDELVWHLTEGSQSATIENDSWKQRQTQKTMGPGVNEWHGIANPNWKVDNG